MVVSIHHLATDAGVEIMREGGNAIDAAVATGFALAVVHPDSGKYRRRRLHAHSHCTDGKSTFIDYREKAPLAATANMYLDAKGDVIPDASIVGYKAIGVPGSVAGMVYAEKKYGKLDLNEVMPPAMRLASDGFVLSDEEAGEFHDKDAGACFPSRSASSSAMEIIYKPGEFFKQPELARDTERIAENPDRLLPRRPGEGDRRGHAKNGGLITDETWPVTR